MNLETEVIMGRPRNYFEQIALEYSNANDVAARLEALGDCVDQDDFDAALHAAARAADVLARAPGRTVRDVAAKLEAIIAHGNWEVHAPLLLQDLRAIEVATSL